MVSVCCVDGCNTSDIDENVIFHKFPRASSLKRKWEEVVPLRKGCSDVPEVCSSHFVDSDYRTCSGKRFLYTNSIPSIFPKKLDTDVRLNGESTNNHEDEDTSSSDDDENDSCEESKTKKEEKPRQSTNRGRGKKSRKRKRIASTSSSDNDMSLQNYVQNYIRKTRRCTSRKMGRPKKISVIEDVDSGDPVEVVTIESHDGEVRNEKDMRFDNVRNEGDVRFDNVRNESDMRFENVRNERDVRNETESRSNVEVAKRRYSENLSLDLEANIPSFLILDVHQKIKQREANPLFVQQTPPPPLVQAVDVENMEVPIDPTMLIIHEPIIEASIDLSQHDNTPERVPPTVIELVTSDEDEVIIQEPKYDLIEVSDETDEENLTLEAIRSKNKRKAKHKGYKYSCHQCTFKCLEEEDYNIHIRVHPEEILKCTICKITTRDFLAFRSHLSEHIEDQIPCHVCSFKTDEIDSYLSHMDTHLKYKCEFCGILCIEKYLLIRHERAHQKKFKCDKCHRGYRTRLGRDKHIYTHLQGNY